MSAEVHTLTGAYAADALEDGERRFFEQHLEDCDACAREVAELQATAARLGAAVAETPPADLRGRVLAEIDHTRQEAPRSRIGASGASRPWWSGLRVAAAAILVVAVGVGVLVSGLYGRFTVMEDAQNRYAELIAAPDTRWIESRGPDGAMGRAVVSPSRGEAMFVVDGMDPAPADHTYELWLIGEAGAQPAGMFDVDDEGHWSDMVTGDFRDAAAIGITIEPMGGSPEPTSEPVMVLDLEA